MANNNEYTPEVAMEVDLDEETSTGELFNDVVFEIEQQGIEMDELIMDMDVESDRGLLAWVLSVAAWSAPKSDVPADPRGILRQLRRMLWGRKRPQEESYYGPEDETEDLAFLNDVESEKAN